MLKLFLSLALFAGLLLASQTNAYAQSSQNAFGHITIITNSIKLNPISGPSGIHVLVIGNGFHSHHILDLTFTDSHNHVFKLGKILVNSHGGFTKHIIIPKNVAIGKGIISVKHGSNVLASASFVVTPRQHDDDHKEKEDRKDSKS